MTDLLKTLALGVVEGFTEFLPISSTGHMILAARPLGVNTDERFWKMFLVVIQIGAIFAVMVYFRDRIAALLRGTRRADRGMTPLEIAGRASGKGRLTTHGPGGAHASAGGSAATKTLAVAADLPAPHSNGDESLEASGATDAATGPAVMDYEPARGGAVPPLVLVIVGTLPVLVIGYLTHKITEKYLEGPLPVALALAVGGALMILIEFFRPKVRTQRVEQMSLKQALGIGMVQVLAAVFPGTSRSAATIMGALVAGLSREAAAEFSFFLAIPAMFAACGYSLFKQLKEGGLDREQLFLLVIGTLTAFLVAWGVIAGFMTYIRRHTFVPFGIYRIVLAVLVFLLLVSRSGR